MTNLLVRDIDEDTKRALAVRAAENGRSQQAEALVILRTTLQPETQSWAKMLASRAREVGGIEIGQPKRHSPRLTGTAF